MEVEVSKLKYLGTIHALNVANITLCAPLIQICKRLSEMIHSCTLAEHVPHAALVFRKIGDHFTEYLK